MRVFTFILSIILSFFLLLSCGTENKPIYNFKATASPEQGGTISPSFGQYEEGKTLEVKATPIDGWEFYRWEGDLTGSDNPTKFKINKEYNVTGVFMRKDYALNITIEGEGSVQQRIVTQAKAKDYPFETVVELSAEPSIITNAIWVFSEWSGDILGTENPITVVVNSEKNITVIFTEYVLKEGEVYNPITGYIWMDRNLGASRVATSSKDSLAYGDLYQWGRAADGHQKRNSPTTYTFSSSDQPGHGEFILSSNPPFDWRSPQNNNLWQGIGGINNPCPDGYRVPTEAEWTSEWRSWSSKDAAGAFASPLKLPVADTRFNRGNVTNIGFNGRYWSGTVDGTFSRFLFFNSSSARMFSYDRAFGGSVRCLKN